MAMGYMSKITGITRSPGDPQVISTGPSSLGAVDQLTRALGWFSIGLGAIELFAPRAITRALGAAGNEGLVRLYGAREIGSGILTLSLEKDAGLWSRVAGDGLDILTVVSTLRPSNPRRGNVGVALLLLASVTVLDIVAAQGTMTRHSRSRGNLRDYHDRSGFPQGLAKAREAASRSPIQQIAKHHA
jgi:hypothetical protein